ncbi:hypothetical protein FHS19_000435 [Paenibacillus rhizosphaerae]|uniref:Uncharacterized protein n=1 Tax=Paenibacillus rhizosphaerae TaxID=297318 RepID=A0A839TGF0_9BACL|nr:hypothetical protein [Paenibacillus rhizosphaerae]
MAQSSFGKYAGRLFPVPYVCFQMRWLRLPRKNEGQVPRRKLEFAVNKHVGACQKLPLM